MIEMTEYRRDIFPIAGILEDLTDEIQAKEIQPLEAYHLLAQRLGQLGLGRSLDYLSTSITSGGHARIPNKGMGEVIAANTRSARLITVHLEDFGQVQAKDVMLPVDLGKTGWDQIGFMNFWSMSICGIDTKSAAKQNQGLAGLESSINKYINASGVDLETMALSNLSPELRRPEYYKYVEAFARLAMSGKIDANPVHRFIKLVDTSLSLGCDSEDHLAETLGIQRLQLSSMKPALESEVAKDIPLLEEDLRVLSYYKGEVTVAAKGSALILTPAA